LAVAECDFTKDSRTVAMVLFGPRIPVIPLPQLAEPLHPEFQNWLPAIFYLPLVAEFCGVWIVPIALGSELALPQQISIKLYLANPALK
jgi:hypothetical protein